VTLGSPSPEHPNSRRGVRWRVGISLAPGAEERPRVSLAAAAVQARRGPARPEGAVEISRTSETASGFLNCESGVRVTPGAPILRGVSDHPSELRRSCGGTCSSIYLRLTSSCLHGSRLPKQGRSGDPTERCEGPAAMLLVLPDKQPRRRAAISGCQTVADLVGGLDAWELSRGQSTPAISAPTIPPAAPSAKPAAYP